MNSASDKSPKVLDVDALLERTMGSVEVAQMVLDSFDSQLAPSVDSLVLLQSQGKSREMHRIAHSLKGAAANVGADQLCLAAGELEQSSLDGQVEAIVHQLEALKRAIAAYIAARPQATANLSSRT